MEKKQQKIKTGDSVIHRDKTVQMVEAIYSDGGARVESGDFYRGSQLCPNGPKKWRPNCGEKYKEDIPDSSDGCCPRRKQQNRN